MRLKLTMLSIAGALAMNAVAQEGQTLAHRTAFEKGYAHNWFITAQGGAAMMHNGHNDLAKLGDRLRLLPSIAVGKWHQPYWATRLKVLGGEAISFDGYKNQTHDTNKFIGAHYDFMFDVLGFCRPATSPNTVRLIPYLGLGYEYKFDSALGYKDAHAATVNAGMQLACGISKRIDLVLEGEGTWNGLHLSDSYPTAHENSLRFAMSAGLNFRLGRVGFTPVRLLDQEAVNSMQSSINMLRAENAELSKRPANCPDLEPQHIAAVDATNGFVANKSILFAHGKSSVSNDQLITVFDAAQFVKNYDGALVVTGYAQKSESRFKELAQKRAQAVAKLLNEAYGIPTEKITVEWKQVDDAPFDARNAWNRIVIIRSK